MGLFHWLITHITPIFIVTSPVTSYADQIWSIHKTRSSAGFSLDIPLIMLVASILKVFYWFGAHFDTSLLLQALLMLLMQSLLLHVALTHRHPTALHASIPFADVPMRPTHNPHTQSGTVLPFRIPRPYGFWRWRHHRPYWIFLTYLTLTLLVLHFGVSRAPNIHLNSSSASAPKGPHDAHMLFTAYTSFLGYLALLIEATLPLPQLAANYRARSCKGFRFSVLANWLVGDCFKMMFFFVKSAEDVPWAFKLCGVFQALCDVGLGVQYWLWGEGGAEGLH